LTYHGIDRALKTVEFGPIGVEAAVAICMERIPRGFERFEDVRDALAATAFGFSASSDLFIELCGNGPAGVSFKFEWARGSWLRRMFGGTVQIERALHHPETVAEHVREFFAREPADFLQWLRMRQSTL